jgi:hypothetical protein
MIAAIFTIPGLTQNNPGKMVRHQSQGDFA